jgi:hypothetical protein
MALSAASVVCVVICGSALFAQKTADRPEARFAKGIVFHDANANRKYDEGDKPLSGIRVSNGRDVVATDGDGRYHLPIDDDTILFVIKPRGWRSPLSETNLPRFYYIHKPNGSPKAQFPGVAPTGPLPKSVDFPMYPQNEPDKFKAVVFGDTQTANRREVAYLAHDILEELVGADASFGVTLGDVVFNDLSVFEPITQAVGALGIPWHNAIGNHDTNFDAKRPSCSNETFERMFGPSHYSFDYGPVHFVILDNIEVLADPRTGEPSWRARIGEDQLEFLKNDLAGTPRESLVVLMMHVPIVGVSNRKSVYRLIEDRPHCLSLSGHTHSHEHLFLDKNDGWRGTSPHHHIIHGTACGCWWGGCPDERGIPNATMGDGTPNGYSIIAFDGSKYSQEYKVAGRDKDYQILVEAPDQVSLAQSAKTKIFANVFNGSPHSTVTMRVDRGKPIAMKREPLLDPAHCRARQSDERLKDKSWTNLSRSFPSTHLWTAFLPGGMKPGCHWIEVTSVDMNGKQSTAHRLISLRP